LLVAATGCGSKGAVAILASIEHPGASVENPSAIAWVLKGNFSLHVELGQVAPTSTDVSISSLALVRAADQAPLVVPGLVSTPPPPYHLEPGAHVDAAIIVSEKNGTPGQSIVQLAYDDICRSPTVLITGSLSDTASDTPTPVSSATFVVTGCP
jgi:hypothetical protein